MPCCNAWKHHCPVKFQRCLLKSLEHDYTMYSTLCRNVTFVCPCAHFCLHDLWAIWIFNTIFMKTILEMQAHQGEITHFTLLDDFCYLNTKTTREPEILFRMIFFCPFCCFALQISQRSNRTAPTPHRMTGGATTPTSPPTPPMRGWEISPGKMSFDCKAMGRN